MKSLMVLIREAVLAMVNEYGRAVGIEAERCESLVIQAEYNRKVILSWADRYEFEIESLEEIIAPQLLMVRLQYFNRDLPSDEAIVRSAEGTITVLFLITRKWFSEQGPSEPANYN